MQKKLLIAVMLMLGVFALSSCSKGKDESITDDEVNAMGSVEKIDRNAPVKQQLSDQMKAAQEQAPTPDKMVEQAAAAVETDANGAPVVNAADAKAPAAAPEVKPGAPIAEPAPSNGAAAPTAPAPAVSGAPTAEAAPSANTATPAASDQPVADAAANS